MTSTEDPVASDAVLTARRDQVFIITLNRPQQKNAINTSLSLGLRRAIQTLDDDPDLRVGVLTGSGDVFCSGLDLKALPTDGMPKGLSGFFRDGSAKPLIAAIEGFALAGGLELALTCDLLVAARGAYLGVPETKVGLFPAGGALLHLPRRLPFGVAMEMALTARSISAEEAHGYGLINRLSDPRRALEIALELAEYISCNAPLGVHASKQVLRAGLGRTEEEFWAMQIPYMRTVFSSEDSKEGPRAFSEKRAPRWTNS